MVLVCAAPVSCSRPADAPDPKAASPAAAPMRADASASPTGSVSPLATASDASAPTDDAPSPFSIVLRGPAAQGLRTDQAIDMVGAPYPLVQRLADGGIVFSSEYGRAHADASGAFSVDLWGKGLEPAIFYTSYMQQGAFGYRWVWSDASLSVVTSEMETARLGPRVESYKADPLGFHKLGNSTSYWSAVARDGSVLALQRTVYEVPNSSMYPAGSGYEANEWTFKPTHVAVLAGPAGKAAPVLPANVCPTTMSAAPDGTLVIAVNKCISTVDAPVRGALRYPPGATHAKVEWFPPHEVKGDYVEDPTAFAASANEIYVASGEQLETWNGSAWVVSTPVGHHVIGSLSRSAKGELWAVTRDDGRLLKRSKSIGSDATWQPVNLPMAPADLLDSEVYAVPFGGDADFRRVAVAPEGQAVRAAGKAPLLALTVDATADEVLVLASAEYEAFLLSTTPRTPVARLPSIPLQRARLAQAATRVTAATGPKSLCTKTFLQLPEGTTEEALRLAYGDAGTSAAPLPDGMNTAVPGIGEAVVEGKKRLVAYGDKAAVDSAEKKLASLHPTRLCGPAVIERSF